MPVKKRSMWNVVDSIGFLMAVAMRARSPEPVLSERSESNGLRLKNGCARDDSDRCFRTEHSELA
jgi:hypothetical protein